MTDKQQLINNMFGLGEKNSGYADFFSGQSYLNMLVADPEISVTVGNVSFEPGCRNNWHKHTTGYQILLVTAGEGLYQEAGKTAQLLHPGDVIVTKQNIKHWHGATENSWFAHIAITQGASEFLEAVSSEDYKAANDLTNS